MRYGEPSLGANLDEVLFVCVRKLFFLSFTTKKRCFAFLFFFVFVFFILQKTPIAQQHMTQSNILRIVRQLKFSHENLMFFFFSFFHFYGKNMCVCFPFFFYFFRERDRESACASELIPNSAKIFVLEFQ